MVQPLQWNSSHERNMFRNPWLSRLVHGEKKVEQGKGSQKSRKLAKIGPRVVAVAASHVGPNVDLTRQAGVLSELH